MDWFKQNPFLGAIAGAAALVLLAGGYLVFSQAGRLSEEETAFNDKKALLDRLQRNKPFPDPANVEATQRETEEAGAMLAEIAKGFEVTAAPISPQAFQDELNKLVKDIAKMAADKGVALPENFYLGFEAYEAQPPAPQAAAQLALQLRSIHAVAKVLVESQVKALGPITRTPLPGEVPAESAGEKEGNTKKKTRGEKAVEAFKMAPFDVNLTADQAAFRLAFNRILDIAPPVFVRLVAVANSAPTPPPKQDPAGAAAPANPEQPAETPGIKPVLGRETLSVDLRLASIAGGENSP